MKLFSISKHPGNHKIVSSIFQSSDLLRYQILQSNVRYFYMNLLNLLNYFQFPQNAW